jgi:ATP-dependent protease ClpP protease subunit
MSKRKLPELRSPEAIEGGEFAIHPRARAAFDPSVRAASRDDNTISILAEIGENWDGTGVTPNRISAALRNIGGRPVTVQINSPGGNFFDGLAIYNMLRAHPEAVTVQILGVAASAASIIAMAGDTIQVAKAGIVMVHNTQWFAMGDRHAFVDRAETMAVFDDALAGLYVDRTGRPRAEIERMMDAETYLSGESAVQDGFADDLLDADRIAKIENYAEPAHRRVAAALAHAKMPRAEIRKLMKELTADMPSAADDHAMPCAGIEADGLAHLRAAQMKLSLIRG